MPLMDQITDIATLRSHLILRDHLEEVPLRKPFKTKPWNVQTTVLLRILTKENLNHREEQSAYTSIFIYASPL